MSSIVNVNGIMRDSIPYVNVNGVLREASTLVNVNGVLREVVSDTQRKVTADDIKSFTFSYILDKNASHPKFPNLGTNLNLSSRLKITGEQGEFIDEVNFNDKGVELRYDRYPGNPNGEEGIIKYDAHIYAILKDDTPIDICCITQTDEDASLNTGDKITDLKINLYATLVYESNGYYITGWNNICSKNQFISSEVNPLKPNSRNYIHIDNYPLLPVSAREEQFNPLAQIGYVMNLHNDGDNMVGSYGILDQTIHWISVNGSYKPFIIEVHD